MPPSRPSALTVLAKSAETLLLAWSPPDFTGFSDLAGFRLLVSEEGVADTVQFLLDSAAVAHNVTGLKPLQAYSVELFARNAAELEGEPANVSTRTISLSKQLFNTLLSYLQMCCYTELPAVES